MDTHQVLILRWASVLASPKGEGAAPSHFFQRPFVFLQHPLVFSVPFRFYLMSFTFISTWNRKVTKENRDKHARPAHVVSGVLLYCVVLRANQMACF